MAAGDRLGAAHGQDAGFGTRLRGLRENASLTQEELANKSGLTSKAISLLERGERRYPYPHTVRALADALGLNEDERAELFGAVPSRVGSTSAERGASTGGSLPLPPTPLVGRERSVQEVDDLLERLEVRVLTLLGPGGVGKTRLALEVAREASGRFPDGVAFVALAPLRDPGRVIHTAVRSLGLREAEGRSSLETLKAHLKDRHFLLVLDNMEHVLAAAGEVADLIEGCPWLTVLVTSRAPLRVRGEHEYPVSPLALPMTTIDSTVAEVLGSPSGRLFAERAQAAAPSFEVTEGNAPAVAAICWRLSGLPLALELAAAKVRFLEPASMLPRLDRALSAGWARDLPERQRTMRATLDWSYDLLAEEERRLFRSLSVFAGGFTMDGAEAVGPEDAFVLLGVLVEQSLVVVGEAGRYGMLEPVRQYALERLQEAGEAEEARRRHAEFSLGMAEEAGAGLSGPDHPLWIHTLQAEHDNIRAALTWMLEHEQAEAALRTAGALRVFWQTRGLLAEGREWLERALALEGARADDPEIVATRANALIGVGWLAVFEDRFVLARERLEESVALYRGLGDQRGLALALTYLGYVATLGRQPDIPVIEILDEAMSLRPLLDDKLAVASLLVLGGLVEAAQGDFVGAIAPTEQALALGREVGDEWGIKLCLVNLGLFTLVAGDLERSEELLRELLQLGRTTDDKLPVQYGLLGLAQISALTGDPGRAARLWGASEAIREGSGIELPPLASTMMAYSGTVATAREGMGEAAFEAAWVEGKAAAPDESLDYALLRSRGHPPGC